MAAGGDMPLYPSKPKSPYGKWVALGVAVVLLIGIAIAVVSTSDSKTLDPKTIIPSMESTIEGRTGIPVTITCPAAEPAQTNYIFDCTATDWTGSKIVRVTENDDQFHVTWELTSQNATGPNGQTN